MADTKIGGPGAVEFGGGGAGGDGTGYLPLRRKRSEADGAGESAEVDALPGRTDAIAVSVAGIPAPELTPAVERAIESLMAEVGFLRRELERLRERAHHLDHLASHHPFLPVLSHRAVLRHIAHAIEHADRLPASPSLACLSLVNLGAIRRDHGLAARDAALAHFCAALKDALRPGDVLGSFGGGDFVALLVVAGDSVAREHARTLIAAVRDRPFEWRGQRLDLDVACGAAVLESGTTPEIALALADADLRATLADGGDGHQIGADPGQGGREEAKDPAMR